MPRRSFDGSALYVGRQTKQNPSIPETLPKEKPVTEILVHEVTPTEKKALEKAEDTRYQEVKPYEPVFHPEYNRLYSTLRTEADWRYTVDNYANGTININSGGTFTSPVNLKLTQDHKRLSEWPDAVQLYLVLRGFTMTAQLPTPIPLEVQVPATAGNQNILGAPGLLLSAIVTTVGASNLVFQDGATGNTIGVVPSTATVNQVFTFNIPFGTLVALKSASTPVVTVGYQQNFNNIGLDAYYNDIIGGQTIPLGNFASNGPLSSVPLSLIPTPITDPGITAVGQLLVNAAAGGAIGVVTYYWQISFSYAYLLPSSEPYLHGSKAKGGDIHVYGSTPHTRIATT